MSQFSGMDEKVFDLLEQVERGELTVVAPAPVFNMLLTLQSHVLVSLVGERWMVTSRGLDLLESWRAGRPT